MKGRDALNSQYKKGVLELCVLSLLQTQDRYGYEISEFLSAHINIAGSSMSTNGTSEMRGKKPNGFPMPVTARTPDRYRQSPNAASMCAKGGAFL